MHHACASCVKSSPDVARGCKDTESANEYSQGLGRLGVDNRKAEVLFEGIEVTVAVDQRMPI
jgi:hypothetical protein